MTLVVATLTVAQTVHLDQYVYVKKGTLASGVKLFMTHVAVTLALMEELVPKRGTIILVLVLMDFLELNACFVLQSIVNVMWMGVKKKLIMESVM